MKLITITIIALCLFTGAASAQNGYSVRGSVADTTQFLKMYDASVMVLDSKDSIMRKFTRAKEDGSFTISGLPAGSYLLLVTYPGYGERMEKFALSPAAPSRNFGTINMRANEKLLNEVLIKGEVQAVKIKGDTIEFNAKAYVVQPNDKVEDLLRQIPGITIDKNGNITANGEAVQKVLVDGEEFFGDDPTLVTKNIRADMVDKLQLYDKKSDQAAFTGIDDGVRTKTINVVLKEDKKKGTFGKAEAGAGNDDYYEAELLYNKFTAHSKYALYGTSSNDGTLGLGFADQNKIGAASTNVVSIDGGIAIGISLGDADSFYNGDGLPVSHTAGVHYDTKWDNNNQSINTNYKTGSLDTKGDFNSIQQQTLPAFTLPNGQPEPTYLQIHNVTQKQTFDNYAYKQKLDFAYQAKFDTSATLKLTTDGSTRDSHKVNNSVTNTTDGDNNMLNQSNLANDTRTNEKIFDFTGLYTKKLKHGRTFSWSLSETYDAQNGTGYQLSTTNYYNNGAVDSTAKINQYKPTNIISSVLNSNMTFTDQFSKRWALTFNYGFALNNSSADKESFNQDANGNYTIIDPTYSSNYKFDQMTDQFGAIFNYRTSKIVLNFGGKASDVNFKQTDENTGNVYTRNFINWLPQADLQYRPTTGKTLNIRYAGSTTQPSISQIQPIASNTDPLNTVIGNPNLKPAFNNRFNFNYNQSQIVSQQNMGFNGGYSFITDQIVNNTTTNAAGQSTTQAVNLTTATPYNFNLNANFNRRIVPWDMRFGINFGTNGSANYNYVNSQLDKTSTNTYRFGLNLSKNAAKKYSFFFNAGPGYSFTSSSLTPTINNNAPNFNSSISGQIYLPHKFIIGSDISYTYTGKTQQIPAQNITNWNANISKTFFKDDNLKLTLAANNILNQNDTYSRNVSGNAITQSYYNTIMRYFLFSISYDFTKFGTSATPAKN